MQKATAFPYIRHGINDVEYDSLGGAVILTRAGAALNLGDVVYRSSATQVNKSTTQTNYAGFVGVVVGGASLVEYSVGHEYHLSASAIVAAAAANDWVLVQISGIAYVKSGGAITAGTNFAIMADTGTAGRVIVGTTAGQMLGVPLETAAGANVWIKALLSHR